MSTPTPRAIEAAEDEIRNYCVRINHQTNTAIPKGAEVQDAMNALEQELRIRWNKDAEEAYLEIGKVRAERDELVERNLATQRQVAELQSELSFANTKLLAAQDELRERSAITPNCNHCDWTNIGCINIGEPGEPDWICHGCVKSLNAKHKAQSETIATMQREETRLNNKIEAGRVGFERIREIIKPLRIDDQSIEAIEERCRQLVVGLAQANAIVKDRCHIADPVELGALRTIAKEQAVNMNALFHENYGLRQQLAERNAQMEQSLDLLRTATASIESLTGLKR